MMPNRSHVNRRQKPAGSRIAQAVAVAAILFAAVWALWPGGHPSAPLAVTAAANQLVVQTGPSGLALPRFVSLKADRVNVRSGPGQDHRVSWTFTREGLPVEVIAEFENWRRIRDSDGAEGWIFHSLLSGRRTGVVAPWSRQDTFTLRQQASEGAEPVALVEAGVVVDLQNCDGQWCRVNVQSVTGWIAQEQLWGVYPREVVR
jgi:SH3-like domain-containing protein